MISQLSSNFDECHQGYTFMDLTFKWDGDSKRQCGEQRHGDLLNVYRAEKRQDMTDKITTVGKVMESRI